MEPRRRRRGNLHGVPRRLYAIVTVRVPVGDEVTNTIDSVAAQLGAQVTQPVGTFRAVEVRLEYAPPATDG